MRKFRVVNIVPVLFLAFFAACTPAATESPQVVVEPTAVIEAKAIVLGDISDDPSATVEETRPFADYLASQLADQGITEVQVRVAGSIEEMAALMKNGEIDLYFDSVYPAALVSDLSDGRIFIRRWKSGVEEYHSVIFVRSDSNITSIEDLSGHMIAFAEDFSTSAYVLPLTFLLANGLTLTPKDQPGSPVGSDEVGYTFSGADENNIAWVISGRVDASSVDNQTFNELSQDIRDQLKVIAETDTLPRHVGIIAPDVDDELLQAIVNALTHAKDTEEGQAAMATFGGTTQFDEFPEGLEAAIVRMHDMAETVHSLRQP